MPKKPYISKDDVVGSLAHYLRAIDAGDSALAAQLWQHTEALSRARSAQDADQLASIRRRQARHAAEWEARAPERQRQNELARQAQAQLDALPPGELERRRRAVELRQYERQEAERAAARRR